MYMQEPESALPIERDDPALSLVIFLCLFGVLQLGVWPGNLLTLIRQSLAGLF
jgi:NADH-quinone oxidoreductase subunit N